MSDRQRFYLTTAIAYANNAPGLHTVYEVIGADVVARWHRMQGDETRFLTGTDEHSVNIAQSAEAAGMTPREFVDDKVGLFTAAEDALLISPDRFIRTTDPDHYRSAQEMVRRAYDNGDIYLGSYDGWYCPSRGLQGPVGPARDRDRDAVPQPPGRAAPVAQRAQLVLPPVGLPGAPPRATTRRTRTSSSRTTGATRCWASSARASRTSRSAAPGPPGASRSPSARTAPARSSRTAPGIPPRARSTSGTTR